MYKLYTYGNTYTDFFSIVTSLFQDKYKCNLDAYYSIIMLILFKMSLLNS